MPSRSQLPGTVKKAAFTKALRRLGFEIDTRGGEGSHYKATWPKTQKSITIPDRLDKDVLHYLLKEIEKNSGILWKDIKREL